jgi:cysteine desulfurase / selenocysteine lyase
MTIYLDNAATTFPKPESVYQAMDTFARTRMANPGRGGHALSRASDALLSEVRLQLMRLTGAPSPEHCILAFSGTDALNIALHGVLVHGDHVVTSQIEHNSVLRPLRALEREGKITLTILEIGKEGILDPDDVGRALQGGRTKLVALTHASNVTGIVQPIAEVGHRAREAGALFLVDAAQTAGLLPIDMKTMCADLVAFPGHKGLYGPPGTGALCIGERAQDLVMPFRTGGTGGESELLLQPTELPYRLEAGTHNVLGLAGLAAGLRFVNETTIDAIHAHEARLRQRLIERLRALKSCSLYGASVANASCVGTLSFNVLEEPTNVAMILDSHFSIAVRSGLHCAPGAHDALGTAPAGTVRASVSWFNTEQDVDALADALVEIGEGE